MSPTHAAPDAPPPPLRPHPRPTDPQDDAELAVCEPSGLCCPVTAALFRDPVFVPEVRTRPLELDAAAAAVRGCRIGCIACMVVLGDAHSLRPILAADEPLG